MPHVPGYALALIVGVVLVWAWERFRPTAHDPEREEREVAQGRQMVLGVGVIVALLIPAAILAALDISVAKWATLILMFALVGVVHLGGFIPPILGRRPK